MKLATRGGFVKYFPLFFWLWSFFSSTDSEKKTLNVALIGDLTSSGDTLSVHNYINDRNLTKISLQLEAFPLNGTSFEDISKRFCSKVLDSNVTVIILQTKRDKLACFVEHLASYFKIPVISSGKAAPLLSAKKHFSIYVRELPSSSSTLQFTVLVDLFRYAGKRRAFIIVSDDTSYELALQYFNENDDGISSNIINLAASEKQDIIQQLLRIKSSTACAVFLLCNSKLAHLILWLAKDLRLISDDVLWILSEKSLRDIQDVYMLPSLIYLMRQHKYERWEDFNRRHLTDSLSLVQRTFESMSDDVVQDYLWKPSNCSQTPVWKKGEQLHRLLTVAANDKRSLKNQAYEILYLQTPDDKEKVWVQLGKWTAEGLSFQPSQLSNSEENSISEITRLRAAVVEYPPLTMKANFDENNGCFQGLECKKFIGNTANFTKHCCYGLAIDVLKYVASQLQFEPIVYFVRDGNYGAKNTTADTWNGIVRDILDEEADIAIDLMANEARSEVIDFSLRWTHAGLALLVLVGEKKVDQQLSTKCGSRFSLLHLFEPSFYFQITDPNTAISYGVVKSSYVDSYFELNEDPIMQSMFQRMRDKKHLVNNFTDGVERIKHRQLDVFISEVLSLDYEVAKQKSPTYPRLQVVGANEPFAETGYSYAFRKNSPWKPKFDFVINRMKADNKPSDLYKKWVSSGEDKSEDRHQLLSVRSLSGVFFLGASLALVASFFLFLENKLFAKGFIYANICADPIVEKGQRKISAEVKRKLLDFSKFAKEGEEYPDISGYMHNRRRRTLMLKSLYNPKSVKRKYEETGEQVTATSSV
ncbi:PREDICTED: glutamate receptor ionotropic, NMDA 2B-like [Acropora digitifera]|uniref:glutamate receptor ionotropic, NMDA 2B-like n=1 Tax=Acropora digitifera TaxID=70779 RepID=UPI00077AB448|nr:PREDICTED: glutamate receptor ionotropic, NMDA 2B-like [Acropora digitifera]